MNAAEILAALNTVERDHEMVLKKVQALKDVVSYLLDPDHADVPDVVAKLWELDEYFAKAFPAHTVEEETTLFPLLERHAPGGPELVARLQREHQEIHLKREGEKMAARLLDLETLEIVDLIDKRINRRIITTNECTLFLG